MKKIYFWGSKDIKDLFKKALVDFDLRGKKVLDFPAGSGDTANYLYDKGAFISALDMFPEFFKPNFVKCQGADLQKTFPLDDQQMDVAICQEGIEHVPNQLFVFQEFNRVLKTGGRFFVTTPNYSNLRSRFSYMLFEAETPKMLPPNEIESIWFGKGDDRVYFGHIFSIGIMKLRCLAKLAGFELVRVHPARINWSAFVIAVIVFPVMFFLSLRNYLRSMRKNKNIALQKRTEVFNQILSLNFHPSVLLGGHLIVEFQKISEASLVKKHFRQSEITST